jgi:antitoxin YefM
MATGALEYVRISVHIHASRSLAMDVITFTDTRQNLKDVMDRVTDDHAPVVVTRQKAEAVVMVALSDWNAIQETMHLLSTPANAARLTAGIAELDAGKGQERDLIEP